MCGIFGVRQWDGAPLDREQVVRSRDRMIPRGPDDSGLHLEPGLALAHRRLAVLDLSPAGRMPMADSEGKVRVVFNGEIYNFRELRSRLESRGYRFHSTTDSEVLVHGYLEWGSSLFERLDGMFAIGIWDAEQETLLLARDPAGEKPLYYSSDEHRVLFGSTLDSLLAWPERWALDPEGVGDYLGFGFVRAPHTIISGVRKVPPGTLLSISATGIRERVFWSIRRTYERYATSRRERSTEEVEELLARAVDSRLESDVPLGAFLSGGVDSSLVCALIAKARPGGVRTYTIGFDDPAFDESAHAQLVAKHLGIENVTRVISEREVLAEVPAVLGALDEPMADYSALPTLAVARLAREEVTVALTGDGADELFGGYRYYSALRGFAAYHRLPLRLRAGIARSARKLHPGPRMDRALARSTAASPGEFFGRSGFFRGSVAGRTLGMLRPDLDDTPVRIVADAFGRAPVGLASVEAGMLWDAENTLAEAWLCKVDRCAMSVSLETRTPLLAKGVIELACSLPVRDKVGLRERKGVLRRALERLLPPSLVNRPKQGFTPPMARWMRGELAPDVTALARESAVAEHGLVSPDGLRALTKEHTTAAADHAQALWGVLLLERWISSRSVAIG